MLALEMSDSAHIKANGITYTPKVLADFVAREMLRVSPVKDNTSNIRILDPAIGDGELVLSLLEALRDHRGQIVVEGFDTSAGAAQLASQRIRLAHPGAVVEIKTGDFLAFVLRQEMFGEPGLFGGPQLPGYDLVIANPPYVRTQVLGATEAQRIGQLFGLDGRVDLYQAFVVGICSLIRNGGTAGIIVSNRFMTTRGGASIRRELRNSGRLRHVWDLGDTKLFAAAVLPAVMVVGGAESKSPVTGFTSIYETSDSGPPITSLSGPIDALGGSGVVALADGRRFHVRQGVLDQTGPLDDTWRILNAESDAWLRTVREHTWCTFGEIGKTRVGVKTCADKVFIRDDWDEMPLRPELVRPLTTHHRAGRYRANAAVGARAILYPHVVVHGKRVAADLSDYPNTRTYLEQHRSALESRDYLATSRRMWYELWVPQDPDSWQAQKLVFRDISERPTFWIDKSGSVVNGDCYWLSPGDPGREPLLWLAVAVANSTFCEDFYDRRFNNKLYSGRRRFITQYVEQFPLPDPSTDVAIEIANCARELYEVGSDELEDRVDSLVWESFGLSKKRRW